MYSVLCSGNGVVEKVMKNSKGRDLLDEITELAGLQYMSDLRLERYKPAVLNALRQIASERYSQAEWVEAAKYITGKCPDEKADLKEAAIELIRAWLQKK